MKRVCYWCAAEMGEKSDLQGEGVFHSLCDDCAHRLRLDERLPELLWAVATLRRQKSRKEQYQTPGVLTTA